MYQLYAYGTKYKKCKNMYLIYPYDSLDIQTSYQYFKNEKNEEKKELHLDILFFDVVDDKSIFNKNVIDRIQKQTFLK